MTSAPPIFDPHRRRALRDRAARRSGSFLLDHLARELGERLALVDRAFADVLLIGPIAAQARAVLGNRAGEITIASLSPAEAARDGGVLVSEDALPFEPGCFDLVVSAGTLDSVSDLPGSLVQIRRVLRPDGLFLAAMFGSGTLPRLRELLAKAEAPRAVARLHPQIRVRDAGDLMSRAGFALPVVDVETLDVRYSRLDRLIDDLRDAGVGNALSGPLGPLGKPALRRLRAEWDALRDGDGRVSEAFNFIHLSGWAPAPGQPRPARPGSATRSLADALKSTG